ncbi:Piso0_002547 [Millerozyma farinosa CBS 7064]|uniref:Piso0_002547 protein n=1 Tax=Pichia sorbitophila (strain ATCC MYA-4447 / BCRC 22081 / CBS 7064 / NBRC 10061 / NRRL Y-12695) TaxID=559304 RepID=G8YFC0_PICSO|nr:Piso0_002547 [Millerozyma farinosa CBS 7064]
MSRIRNNDERDDSEESLISQFESTLTIKPSSNDVAETEDVSIDHTVYTYNNTLSTYIRDQTIADIDEEDEREEDDSSKITAKERVKDKPDNRTVRSKLIEEVLRSKEARYQKILAPSPFVDISLSKFTKTFAEFLNSNSHIQKESPRFARETDKTLVVVSPFSAEHAFGRTWVSKSYLATIFERPQRLLAASIGVSAAVTMYPFFYKVVNSTKRGDLFAPYVTRVHGKKWPTMLYDLCLSSYDKLLQEKLEVPEDWNTGDIYLTPKTITALEGSIGTIETTVDSLFKDKHDSYNLAFAMIRPPGHHCHASLPSGFCLLNNVQVAIEYAHEKYGITHCAVLDIDLHHGDGTQDICMERAGFLGDFGKDENETSSSRDDYGKAGASFPKVGYFSLHDIKSYPTETGYATKENIVNASICVMDHDINIWNVHLQEWSTEEEFYKHYSTKYVNILNRANQFLNQAKRKYEKEYQEYLIELSKYNKYIFRPHLYHQPVEKPVQPAFKPLIIISAGFDASEYENPQMQRHGINVPTSFYATFAKDAVKLAKIHTNGKLISFMEGGYSDGALTTGVFSHLIGLTNNPKESNLDDTLLWNNTWGSEMVAKELIKGCKKSWTPYKKPQTDVTIWANEVIKLGRSMIPNAILSSNYMHNFEENVPKHPSPENKALSKMEKELIDTKEQDIPVSAPSPLKKDPNDSRKVLRHTRAYYKKLALAQKEKDSNALPKSPLL